MAAAAAAGGKKCILFLFIPILFSSHHLFFSRYYRISLNLTACYSCSIFITTATYIYIFNVKSSFLPPQHHPLPSRQRLLSFLFVSKTFCEYPRALPIKTYYLFRSLMLMLLFCLQTTMFEFYFYQNSINMD